MTTPDRRSFIPEPHELQPLKGKLAVITGTSRGIGAEIAVSLAGVGVDIVGSHVDPKKEAKQEDTSTRVVVQGASFDSIIADISEEKGREALLQVAIGGTQKPRGVDYLILNAAGGLERGRSEDWAEQINIKAQHELVKGFVPNMNPGGKIIFMTSLWAHRYGDVKQLPAYGSVASTKHRFEEELRARIPELEQKGIGVGIVVGHIIKGTAAHLLFSRMAKEEMVKLEQMAEGGRFPEASEMGSAVRDILLSNFESGQTIYVGGQNAEKIERHGRPLTREEIQARLPMYGDTKLLVDTFSLESAGIGKGYYTVRPQDTEGHFTGPFKDIQLWRGVDQLESLAQAMGLTILETEGNTGALGLFREVRGGVKFIGMIFPGDKVELHTSIVRRTQEGITGNGEIRVGEKVVMQAEGIDLALTPDANMARKLINLQKSKRSEGRE